MTRQLRRVEEQWDKIRLQVRERWPLLTRNDLQLIDGDSRKLVALVHQRTGDNLSEIEAGIDEIAIRSDGLLSRIVCTVKAATESVSEGASQTFEATRRRITKSPAASDAATFCLGLLTGFCISGLFTGSIQTSKRSGSR